MCSNQVMLAAERACLVLAEDDDDLRQLLSEALRRQYLVAEARDGRELLALLAPAASELTFDLVVTDIRMPGASGLEALAAMALIGESRRVILLSAYVDDQLRFEVARLGAGLLLTKPIATAALLNAVAYVLSRLPPR